MPLMTRHSPARPRSTPTILAAAIAALFTLPAAQAADTALPAVTVTASPLNATTWAETLSQRELATRRAVTNDTASLLLGLPGVAVNANGGVSGLPQINGLADDRLAVSLDGMGLIASCPNHMNPVLSYVSPSQVASVTVFPGVAPVSAGGDQIGGAIEVKTAPPQFAAPGKTDIGGSVSGGWQSNGDARSLGLSAHYATDRVSLRYDGAWAKADDYTAGGDFKPFTATGRPGVTLGRDVVGSTAYDVRNHALTAAWTGSGQLLELGLGYQDVPYQLYPNQRMDMLGNTEHRINLHWAGQFAWGELDARLYHEHVDHHMDFGPDKQFYYGMASMQNGVSGYPCSPISATCAAGMPMDTESRTTGARVKASFDLSSSDTVRVGGDWQRYRLEDWWPPSGGMMWPGTFYNIHDGQRDRFGLWGEWQKQFTTQWQTLAGVRVERVRTDAGPVSGYANTNGMGMMMSWQQRDAAAFNAASRERTDTNVDVSLLSKYRASETLDLDLGLGRSVRSPNLYQRYAWSTWDMAAIMNNFVGDGNGYIGNLNLKPEKATTLTATADWHSADRAWNLQATPFYTHIDDYIDAVQWNPATNAPAATRTINKFVILKYVNQTARLYGLNLAGKMPLAASTALGSFGLEGVVNFTRGKNTDTGDNLYAVMPLNARVSLTQSWGGWNNAVEVVLVKAKTDVSAVRNEIPTPGYGLLNLRASYSWKQARVDFGVDNVLDKLYYLPTGGAYVGQGRTMAINGVPWGIAVPGPGRSFYARLKLDL